MRFEAEQLSTLIEPTLSALGLSLWAVKVVNEKRRCVVKVFIDLAIEREETKAEGAEGSVTLVQCALASRQISALLDVEDQNGQVTRNINDSFRSEGKRGFNRNKANKAAKMVKSVYHLEVSSPGLDRQLFKLKHFQDYVGMKIQLNLQVAVTGKKKIQGILKQVEKNGIIIHVDGVAQNLKLADIAQAKLVPEF